MSAQLDVDDLLDAVAVCEDADVRATIATLSCKELTELTAEIVRDKADEDCRIHDEDIYDDLLNMVATQWRMQHAIDQRKRELYREAMTERYRDDPAALADVLARYGLVTR